MIISAYQSRIIQSLQLNSLGFYDQISVLVSMSNLVVISINDLKLVLNHNDVHDHTRLRFYDRVFQFRIL